MRSRASSRSPRIGICPRMGRRPRRSPFVRKEAPREVPRYHARVLGSFQGGMQSGATRRRVGPPIAVKKRLTTRPERVSQSDLARILGLTPQRVHQYVKRGLTVGADGRIEI